MPHPGRTSFTIIALGAIAGSGLMEAIKGLILPHMMRDLGLSPGFAAAILTAGGIGFLLTSLGFGGLTQRLGLKRVVLAGATLALLMLTLFLTLRLPALLYFAGLGLGAGGSLVEMSTSLPISLLYDGRAQGRMLNLLHGFFGIGTLVGTAWAGSLLSAGWPWQSPFLLVGLSLALVAGLFVARPAIPVPEPAPTAGLRERSEYGTMLRDPAVRLAAMALAAAVGAEAGLTIWIPAYLQAEKGISEALSAAYAALFFLGFTGMRLAGSWLINRFGPTRMVSTLALLGLGGIICVWALPGQWAWLLLLCGMGMATGFPTSVALVAARYPSSANRVYSLMYTAGGITGISIGPAMGWIAERAGLSAAMWLPAACYGLLAGIMLRYGRRV